MDQCDVSLLQRKPKWQGKARVELETLKPNQVWPLLEDFFGLNKWFPTLDICLPIEGVSGRPGCVRYCAGFKTPINTKTNNNNNHKEGVVNWAKHKLLSIDSESMVYTYSIVDGNVGLEGYVATVRVGPTECRGDGPCFIEWLYELEPVEGGDPRELDEFIGAGLRVMATRMESALRACHEVTRKSWK